MLVSQKLTQTVKSLGINTQESEAAKNLLNLIHQVIFWETDSRKLQDKHIPGISQQFHAGVLQELNFQREARLNAFNLSLDAIKEFNQGANLGAVMANAMAQAVGNNDTQIKREDERQALYQDIQNSYSDYLSSVGLEAVNSGKRDFSILGIQLPQNSSQEYQNFMDKVNEIIDPEKTFIAETDKDRELIKFVEELTEELESIPSIKKEHVANAKLFDYFVNEYSDQDMTQSLSSNEGTISLTPTKVALNINDGTKLVAFLAEIDLQQVDDKFKERLELVKSTILEVMQEPFIKGIPEDIQQKRLEGLYSGIRQFRAIEIHLDRLGLDTSELKEYIRYSNENILPQFVIVKEHQLALGHDPENPNFAAYNWHGDSTLENYQERMSKLVNQLQEIGSVLKASKLQQECVAIQVANIEFAIQDMNNFLSGKESKYCWDSNELISQKLEIARTTLEQIKAQE